MKTQTHTATCSRDGSTYCVGAIEHDGRTFESGGGAVTPTHLACYPNNDGTVALWDGTVIGRYRWISSRPAIFFGYRSWRGARYYYGRARANGVTYTLRGFGVGMLARGKATTMKGW